MTMRSPLFIEAMAAYDEERNEDALRKMEQCAERGEPVACYLAALWYFNGEGAAVNLSRSDKWLRKLEKLAEEGNTEAQWEVGQHYRFADLFPLSIERANYWLERAAASGFGEAQHHLAWYLETGQYDYSVDLTASEIWYQRAFERGHPETIYKFALRKFKNGNITEDAIELLQRAAEKGFAQAAQILRENTH